MDLVGLHLPAIAYHGWRADLLDEWRPDVIWMPYPHYTRLHYLIRESGIFQTEYEYFPDLLVYGLAIRRDSQHYEAIRQEVCKLRPVIPDKPLPCAD